MVKNGKFRAVTLAVITMLLCVVLIGVGTFALFSDTRTLTTHLQAANLKIKLERIYLEYCDLADDGYIDEFTNDEVIDFTDNTEDNVFGYEDGDLIAPTWWREATMRITNNGTVAFSWWITVAAQDGLDTDLIDQISVTVTLCDVDEDGNVTAKTVTDEDGNEIPAEYSFKLSEGTPTADGIAIGGESSPVSEVAVGGTGTFKVKLVFDNLANDINNLAQDENLTFDLIVNAVQAVKRPEQSGG